MWSKDDEQKNDINDPPCCPPEKVHLGRDESPRRAEFVVCCAIRILRNRAQECFLYKGAGNREALVLWQSEHSLPGLRGDADIPVMQTSQYRDGNEFARAGDFWRLCMRNRRVTRQALVGPG